MSGHEKSRAVVLTALMVVSVFAAGIAFTGTVAAENIEVSGGDGLQQAIDNAAGDGGDADTVTVTDSATYDPITIDQSNLTVRTADGATINATEDGEIPVVVNAETQGEDPTNVTVSGFTIGDGGNDIQVLAGIQGSSDEGTNATLTDNTFVGTSTQSISVSDRVNSVTITDNSFETTNSDLDVFVGEPSSTTVNGENTANDQIVAVAQANSGEIDFRVGGTEYGIALSQENVTTASSEAADEVSVEATVYGAAGDGALQFTLQNPSGETVQTDIVTDEDGDGLYEFSVDDDFQQEGNYTLSVDDTNSERSGSTVINSEYDVDDLQPVPITEGTSPEINGTLVDRSGDPVSNEQVGLQVDSSDDDSNTDTDTTNDSGVFVLNEDGSATFDANSTVLITGDNANDGDDGSTAADEIVYEQIEVQEDQPDDVLTLETNRSSVPFEIPTGVSVEVFDEDGFRITGDELEQSTLTAEQNGTDVAESIEKVDTDDDGVIDTFAVSIEATQRDTPVTLTVNDGNGNIGTMNLTVGDDAEQPPAEGNIDAPANTMFGNVNVSETKTQTVTVTNEGDASVTVNETSISGSDAFTVVNGGAPFTLDSGESQDVVVQFAPDSAGDKSATLTTDTENDGTETTQLSGTGVAVEEPPEEPAVGELDAPAETMFGTVDVGNSTTQTVTLSNEGDAPVTVTQTSIEGADGDDYNVVGSPNAAGNDDDASFTIAPGESAEITVEYAPDEEDEDDSARLISNTANDGREVTQLSGTATEPMPVEDGQNTLTIEGTGEAAQYVFSTSSSDLNKSTANDANLNDADEIRRGYVADGEVGISNDSYTFSGTLETFGVSGDANVYLNGELINDQVENQRNNVIEIEGTGERATYDFAATDGNNRLEKTQSNNANVNGNDEIFRTTANGQAGISKDAYGFNGVIDSLEVNGDANVYVNGRQVDPASEQDNMITIIGTGEAASYEFTVDSGDIAPSAANYANINANDEANGATASGQVGISADSFDYNGDITSFDVSGADVQVYVDGEQIDQDNVASEV
jgi:surface glycoprotein (TIGR04207 family)